MAEVRDVVGLLYRADWTRLSLSAQVHQEQNLGLSRQLWRSRSVRMREPSADEVPLGVRADRTALRVAPGGRFRQEPVDQGSGSVRGSDGVRGWRWFPSGSKPSPGSEMAFGNEPPCPELLLPSELLSGYTLRVHGERVFQGREVIAVTATQRPVLSERRARPRRNLGDAVDLLVDAELGILLRREEIFEGQRLALAELDTLTICPAEAVDETQFAPPPGSIPCEDIRETWRRMIGGPGWEAAKTAASLAAGGVGVMIRYGPQRTRAGAEDGDSEAAMPELGTDAVPPLDPASSEHDQPGDEVLYLLYSSGTVPGITATVHQWHDVAAMAASVPDGARGAGHGGLGYLLDSVTGKVATTHTVVQVQVADAGRYRFDYLARHGTTGDKTIGSDGQLRWIRQGDKIITGESTRPPNDIAELIDASWLLGYRLSGGTAITYRGRAAYQLRVTRVPGGPPEPMLRFFPADAIVDAELGCLLRLICYAEDVPTSWREIREVSPADDPGDFGVPGGLRVAEETGNPLADAAAIMPGAAGAAVRTAVEVTKRATNAATAARRFLRGSADGS
jgi:hypothetical protein